MLLTLTLAHHLILWWSYPDWPTRALGFLGILIVVNDWLTTRSTYDLYSGDVFALDLMVILILNGIPGALSSAHEGNSLALFWLLLSLCELCYACWDIVFQRQAPESDAKKSLGKWTIASLAAACLYGTTSAFHEFGSSAVWLAGLDSASGVFSFSMLVVWNVARFRRNRAAGHGFLE